jgi:formate hydrogenlyase subunit 6/NADH:ubiquinone oxidoreductase subunit I
LVGELCFLADGDVSALLAALVARQPVLAPVKRGLVSHAFAWVSDAGEIELDYVRTLLPPKRAMLPWPETLLEFRRGSGTEVSAVVEETPYALVGIHPCDLFAVTELAWAYLERHEKRDVHYQARREAATIIGVECQPDEFCFCASLGTAGTRQGADLFLTPVTGGCVAEVLTEKGDELRRETPGRAVTAEELAAFQAWPEEKERRTTLRLLGEVSEYPDLLEARYDSSIWADTARRCYSCGTCTNACPTCICFDVHDEVEVSLTAGRRVREYDSCQHLEFALVAGPHNFRPKRPDRVRHRWFRKFSWLQKEYGRPFCVGCGRCTQECTADIGWVAVLNAVYREAKEARAR